MREKKRPPNLKRLLMTSLCYEGHKVAFTTSKKKKTPPPWHLHLFLFGGCLLFLSAVCIHNLIYQLSWILQITCFVVQLPVRTRINNLSANISIKTKYIRHKQPITMHHKLFCKTSEMFIYRTTKNCLLFYVSSKLTAFKYQVS